MARRGKINRRKESQKVECRDASFHSSALAFKFSLTSKWDVRRRGYLEVSQSYCNFLWDGDLPILAVSDTYI